jgi:hypothetical protein
MKFDKLMGTFVLEFVLVATLVTLAAIAVQAQAKPKEDQPDVRKTVFVAQQKDYLSERTLPGFKPASSGQCDMHCGLKPIPPIGCGPEAVCACSGSYCQEPCGWVFTNCRN